MELYVCNIIQYSQLDMCVWMCLAHRNCCRPRNKDSRSVWTWTQN